MAGDVNDDFGLDCYEQRFSRGAVEILLGYVQEDPRPDRVVAKDRTIRLDTVRKLLSGIVLPRTRSMSC